MKVELEVEDDEKKVKAGLIGWTIFIDGVKVFESFGLFGNRKRAFENAKKVLTVIRKAHIGGLDDEEMI